MEEEQVKNIKKTFLNRFTTGQILAIAGFSIAVLMIIIGIIIIFIIVNQLRTPTAPPVPQANNTKKKKKVPKTPTITQSEIEQQSKELEADTVKILVDHYKEDSLPLSTIEISATEEDSSTDESIVTVLED